jgi:hypothetical protein
MEVADAQIILESEQLQAPRWKLEAARTKVLTFLHCQIPEKHLLWIRGSAPHGLALHNDSLDIDVDLLIDDTQILGDRNDRHFLSWVKEIANTIKEASQTYSPHITYLPCDVTRSFKLLVGGVSFDIFPKWWRKGSFSSFLNMETKDLCIGMSSAFIANDPESRTWRIVTSTEFTFDNIVDGLTYPNLTAIARAILLMKAWKLQHCPTLKSYYIAALVHATVQATEQTPCKTMIATQINGPPSVYLQLLWQRVVAVLLGAEFWIKSEQVSPRKNSSFIVKSFQQIPSPPFIKRPVPLPNGLIFVA